MSELDYNQGSNLLENRVKAVKSGTMQKSF